MSYYKYDGPSLEDILSAWVLFCVGTKWHFKAILIRGHQMKRCLILLLLLVAGCENSLEEMLHGTKKEIYDAANQKGVMTNRQAEILTKEASLANKAVLNGLTSITDEQAESLSKVGRLHLNGLASITDVQAEILSKIENVFISADLQPLIEKFRNE